MFKEVGDNPHFTVRLKRDMMELWRGTFHDQEEYVRLVFDTYFDSSIVAYRYDEADGKLVSAMLGIPYLFGDGKGHQIKALYLCGLATRPEYRGHGIMSSLIGEVCARGEREGYGFAFLIPADEGLRFYYRRHGFTDGICRKRSRYVAGHDFYREYVSELAHLDEKDRLDRLRSFSSRKVIFPTVFDDKLVAEYHDFIEKNGPEGCVFLMHSARDTGAFLRESVLSGGFTVLVKNSDSDEILGLATALLSDDGVSVPHLWYKDSTDRLCLLNAIKLHNRNASMTVWDDPSEARVSQLWAPFYEGVLPGASDVPAVCEEVLPHDEKISEKYGMVRFLSVSEILKFASCVADFPKFSILVKRGLSGNSDDMVTEFDVDGGEVCETRRGVRSGDVPLTVDQMQEVMLEPGNDVASGIFEIPHLSLRMSHLLD